MVESTSDTAFKCYDKFHNKVPADIVMPKDAQYCVTEKIHGSNFSIHVFKDGSHEVARRNGYLKKNEGFMGHDKMLKRDFEKLHALAMDAHKLKDCDRVIIYGELFGGIYPGDQKIDGQPPQITIYYSPQKLFSVFDIAYIGEENAYFAYEKVVELAKKHEVMYATPLFVGDMDKAFDFNFKFPTTIPAELGLEPPTSTPKCNPENLAEGVVVKPWDVETPFEDRPMVKHKIPEFSEDDSKAQKNTEAKKPDEILGCANRNRVDAAVSKLGDEVLLDPNHDITELHTMIMADIGTEHDFSSIPAGKLKALAAKVRTEINTASFDRRKALSEDGSLPEGKPVFRFEEGAQKGKSTKTQNPEEKKV